MTPRDRTAVNLLLEAGLRAAEATALRWEDIDQAAAFVRVERGKGAKDRVVPITYDVLRALLLDRGHDTHLLWDTRWGHAPIHARTLHDTIARIGAGLDIHLHPHRLRHTYATESLRCGITIYEVSLLLGHHDLATTAIYLHVAPEDLAARVRAARAHGPLQLQLIA